MTQHIHTESHHESIRKNRFNGYINELAEEIQRVNKRKSEYKLADMPSKYRLLDA